MSVSVAAFSSKSRLITAANWSSVSKTEKSSAGKKLKGKTIRPYRLTTNGFMWTPSNRIVPGYDLTTDGILRQVDEADADLLAHAVFPPVVHGTHSSTR